MEEELNKGSSEGAVYVEFLMVFFPMMLLWLGIGQIGLMYGGHILVHSAAARSARAAVVIIPDDSEGHEERYNGVPPFQIGDGGEGLEAYKNAPSGGRLEAIRKAARITLAPISPSLGSSGLGGVAALLVGYLWTDFAVAVTFPAGDGEYLTRFEDPTGPVTAKVTYLYKCPVPVVNRIICRNYFGADSFMSEETLEIIEEAGEFGGFDFSLEPGIDPVAQEELETVGGELLGMFGLGIETANSAFEIDATGWRFYPLTAEKTLPLQGKY